MHIFRCTLREEKKINNLAKFGCFLQNEAFKGRTGHTEPPLPRSTNHQPTTDCYDVKVIEPSQLTSTGETDGAGIQKNNKKTKERVTWLFWGGIFFLSEEAKRSDPGKDVGLPLPRLRHIGVGT